MLFALFTLFCLAPSYAFIRDYQYFREKGRYLENYFAKNDTEYKKKITFLLWMDVAVLLVMLVLFIILASVGFSTSNVNMQIASMAFLGMMVFGVMGLKGYYLVWPIRKSLVETTLNNTFTSESEIAAAILKIGIQNNRFTDDTKAAKKTATIAAPKETN